MKILAVMLCKVDCLGAVWMLKVGGLLELLVNGILSTQDEKDWANRRLDLKICDPNP